MRLTGIAVGLFKKLLSPDLNIALERAVRTRAEVLLRVGNVEQARAELQDLAGTLGAAHVKRSVIARIEDDAERCGR
jgi:hypothetical protein